MYFTIRLTQREILFLYGGQNIALRLILLLEFPVGRKFEIVLTILMLIVNIPWMHLYRNLDFIYYNYKSTIYNWFNEFIFFMCYSYNDTLM